MPVRVTAETALKHLTIGAVTIPAGAIEHNIVNAHLISIRQRSLNDLSEHTSSITSASLYFIDFRRCIDIRLTIERHLNGSITFASFGSIDVKTHGLTTSIFKLIFSNVVVVITNIDEVVSWLGMDNLMDGVSQISITLIFDNPVQLSLNGFRSLSVLGNLHDLMDRNRMLGSNLAILTSGARSDGTLNQSVVISSDLSGIELNLRLRLDIHVLEVVHVFPRGGNPCYALFFGQSFIPSLRKICLTVAGSIEVGFLLIKLSLSLKNILDLTENRTRRLKLRLLDVELGSEVHEGFLLFL